MFEVIISDDGSTDETGTVADSFASGHLPNVRYLFQPNSGASAARNQAIHAAQGRLLLIINDDTIAVPTLLADHVQAHEIYPDESCAILGRVTVSDEIPKSIFAAMHLDASYKLLNEAEEYGWRAFFTCNISVKRSFLLKHGLFEEKFRVLHEDLELGERLSHYGLTIRYLPKALAYHYHYVSEQDFLKSAQREGESLAIWYRKAPHLKSELASLGFYPTMPLPRRIRCVVADSVINDVTISFLLPIARYLSDRRPEWALGLYSKIYQALKRKSIRNKLL
jgi:GT2 family glycosyltransferase